MVLFDFSKRRGAGRGPGGVAARSLLCRRALDAASSCGSAGAVLACWLVVLACGAFARSGFPRISSTRSPCPARRRQQAEAALARRVRRAARGDVHGRLPRPSLDGHGGAGAASRASRPCGARPARWTARDVPRRRRRRLRRARDEPDASSRRRRTPRALRRAARLRMRSSPDSPRSSTTSTRSSPPTCAAARRWRCRSRCSSSRSSSVSRLRSRSRSSSRPARSRARSRFSMRRARVLSVTSYATNLVELIGLGLAIDYSLLIVCRFREELAREDSPTRAIVRDDGRRGPRRRVLRRRRRDRPRASVRSSPFRSSGHWASPGC